MRTGRPLLTDGAHVEFGQKGLQKFGARLGASGSNRKESFPQLLPRKRVFPAFEELPHDFGHQDAPAGESLGVGVHECVDAGNQVVPECDCGPTPCHSRRAWVAQETPCVRPVCTLVQKAYALVPTSCYVAQAASVPIMSDAPLLVDPPSQRLSGTHPTSGSAKASASPNTPPGVSGSNSTDAPRRVFTQDILATCHCGREFPVNSKSDDLPYHHEPNDRRALKAVCHGSGRRASTFAEA